MCAVMAESGTNGLSLRLAKDGGGPVVYCSSLGFMSLVRGSASRPD